MNVLSNAAHRPALALTLLSGATLLGATLFDLATPTPASADQQFLKHGSLVVSSSIYDNTQGPVATLKVGSTLPNTATATTPAVADNNYVSVWANENVDASFGVTSAIQLTDIDLSNGKVFRSMQVPVDQVVTSFSSKSELGLHVLNNWPTVSVVFSGYAGAAATLNAPNPHAVGVGLLDASNSDAVAGQDPTNPVTFAFGNTYAFRRTIVSVDEKANISYTPTDNYGGNNGRSALLGSNGLYYMVGNANNGNAATFGSSSNGTKPDVTETTGLEVVTPVRSSVVNTTIASAASAQVDPLLQFQLNKPAKGSTVLTLDKPGKDNNYRGVTEFGGALFFTKGSGSNGIDTVYTVSAPNLPTVTNATSAAITVVPGFPTDSARATGGDFTPFAVFFANPTTMYVSDEGSGDGLDASSHAGLQKWILGSNGSWQLQYVLRNGLIGVVDNVTGSDGPWPTITTVGLRNLTGRINGNGTVTLWATTSTSSASVDNGADPNKVVEITDQIAATTLNQVANELFTTVAGPVYRTVFRGVGFVE